MKTIKYFSLLALTASLVFTSCKKDPDEEPAPTTPAATTGSLNLHFENMVDTNALVLNSQFYTNANGDTFNVTKFNYYISNIKLLKSGVVKYTESNSYHLLQASDLSSLEIALSSVPFDTYDGIEFMIGVDSARNVSGAQTGALDPANGMFWSWSSGYIMVKMEGTSPQSPSMGGALTFHVGGFSGANNTLKTVSPAFNAETAIVSSSITPEIHFAVDLSEMFKNPTTTNFATTNMIHMPGAAAKTIADNYADMFSVEHIHN
ncbi:MAG: hypothetical protein J0L87_00305 [Bacteroidetes bacterium]|nr:hypothetical protein [Bacteroidota bacterium]